ncbi:MAG: hypothetical protein WC683_11025 [bacterium]
MGQQLKQALLNAGIVSDDKLKEMDREKSKERHLKKGGRVREDQIRIVCEACEKSAPDVERYFHKNRLIEGKEWLCLRCADEYQINDEFRATAQSTQSKQGLFIRQYGRTKKI